MRREVGGRRDERDCFVEAGALQRREGKVRKEKGGPGVDMEKLREQDITFRTLPESVGFHAEGGAEALFIV